MFSLHNGYTMGLAGTAQMKTQAGERVQLNPRRANVQPMCRRCMRDTPTIHLSACSAVQAPFVSKIPPLGPKWLPQTDCIQHTVTFTRYHPCLLHSRGTVRCCHMHACFRGSVTELDPVKCARLHGWALERRPHHCRYAAALMVRHCHSVRHSRPQAWARSGLPRTRSS
jgi:hypothetical protein